MVVVYLVRFGRRKERTIGTSAAFCRPTCCSGAVNQGAGEEDTARPIRVTTGGMAYGPHAVARHDGKVLFVRGAAPDEDVDVVVREDRRTFAYADVVAVVRPSAVRRPAPCPYLPRCGGCPWQHLTYEAQLAAKRLIVHEHLRRIAGLEAPVAPVLASPCEFGSRQRLKLRAANGAVGFYAAASHTLVAVTHCPIAEPAVEAAIPWAADLAGGLASNIRRIEVLRRDAGGDVVAAAEVEGPWIAADEGRCGAWLSRHPAVRGLVLHGRRWRRAWGDDHVTVCPEPEIPLTVRAGTFVQVNPGANEQLVRTVLQTLSVGPARRVLDLYAGAGNFTLPLARRGVSVVAVEGHRQAAEDGIANARRLGLDNVRFIIDDVRRAVARLAAAGERFDAVLLDPPRSGAAEIVEDLCRVRAARLVYVSCDPATLARDLKRLSPQFRVEAIQPVDMFPHSYHVESVVGAVAA